MKKNILLTITLLMSASMLWAQRTDYPRIFPQGMPLNALDSIYLSNLPELTLPPALRQDPLPPLVDNSEFPYLRPVFTQEGSSCGQACLVGYNFTYEMDRYRNVSADELANQYATHFTYNFMNGGNGWFGVSYFHSMEVLRLCGNMNCVDYGGSFYDNGTRWIDGYDNYYHAMHNRIKGAYSINTASEEGILTLKHWIYDHLEGSPFGGVASFYANTPWNATHFAEGTPEEGKYVVTNWYPAATHAMTIVGYNDSIRYDYNGDGIYTNNIDLNGDDVLDVQDWEIGGVKFVNSHGVYSQDSGFCYMMYKVLAEEFIHGGIWNQEVHVLDINENYEPLLTFRVTLKHTYREKIRVRVGVNADTSAGMPAFIMEYPIFNFQGANYFMQGQGNEEYKKTLEFGLDVTPLYSYVEQGQPARYFLIVDENDPNGEGTGELLGFSLIDYSGTPQEIGSDDVPGPLEENGITVASLVYQSSTISKPMVVSSGLPIFTEGVPYSQQLQASGGATPYTWDLAAGYTVSSGTEVYNPVTMVQVMPNEFNDTIITVPLAWDFPYFGKEYDTLYMHANGYLQFKPEQLPDPYMQDQKLLLRSHRIIAPLTNDDFWVNPDENDGAWYEWDNDHYTFRWKVSWTGNAYATEYDISVTIFPDGSIRFDYGNVSPGGFLWASGISEGDLQNWFMSPPTDLSMFTPGMSILFTPGPLPRGMELSPEGLFSGTPSDNSHIFDLVFRVTDNNAISSTRHLQFTSWPALSFEISGGGDPSIDYGDTVRMDATIVNMGASALTGGSLHLALEDPYAVVIDDEAILSDLPAGQTVVLDNCFEFIMDRETPDAHPIWLNTALTTGQGNWLLDIPETVSAPLMKVWDVDVLDGNNGILETGETAGIQVTLINDGHADMTGVTGQITFVDPTLELLSGNGLEFGDLIRGFTARDTFEVHALDSTPNGYEALIGLQTQCDQQITNADSIFLQLGKKPVLVIDFDPHFNSAPYIYEVMQEIGVVSEYRTYIPGNLDEFQCLFISLGINNSYHDLTWQEGKTLANYLDAGGRIYMEGRMTWTGTIGTPVHPKFNIGTTGTPAYYTTVEGIDSTFLEGIEMNNGALQPVCMYWLYPLEPAFSLMRDTTSLHVCIVANDAGTYRTIGSIIELGTLEDGSDPSTRSELILRILDFFGISYSLTDIPEPRRKEPSLAVLAFPNPFSERITFRVAEELPGASVTLTISDLSGRTVRILADHKRMPARMAEWHWDGTNDQGMEVSSGIYIYHITSGGLTGMGKVVFIR